MPYECTLCNVSLSTLNWAAVWHVWCARQAGCSPQGATVVIQPFFWLELSKKPPVSSPDEVYQTKKLLWAEFLNSIIQSASVSPGIDLRTAKVTVKGAQRRRSKSTSQFLSCFTLHLWSKLILFCQKVVYTSPSIFAVLFFSPDDLDNAFPSCSCCCWFM